MTYERVDKMPPQGVVLVDVMGIPTRDVVLQGQKKANGVFADKMRGICKENCQAHDVK